jgi:dephospho-CoA kinase
MKIIGLTGPSGSGKSTLSLFIKEQGTFVIDCDKVARTVAQKETVLLALEKAFGGILENGLLNRKALAEKAFCSEENTQKLNNIMLPEISAEIENMLEVQKISGTKTVFLDAPTLFESGMHKKCDFVIAVLANENIRAERILKRDSLTSPQLKSRLNASKPDDFYLSKAEYVIYNNENFENTKKQLEEILSKENCYGK